MLLCILVASEVTVQVHHSGFVAVNFVAPEADFADTPYIARAGVKADVLEDEPSESLDAASFSDQLAVTLAQQQSVTFVVRTAVAFAGPAGAAAIAEPYVAAFAAAASTASPIDVVRNLPVVEQSNSPEEPVVVQIGQFEILAGKRHAVEVTGFLARPAGAALMELVTDVVPDEPPSRLVALLGQLELKPAEV